MSERGGVRGVLFFWRGSGGCLRGGGSGGGCLRGEGGVRGVFFLAGFRAVSEGGGVRGGV